MLEFHWNYLQSLHTKQARVFLAYTQICWEEEEEEGEEKEEEEKRRRRQSLPSPVSSQSPKRVIICFFRAFQAEENGIYVQSAHGDHGKCLLLSIQQEIWFSIGFFPVLFFSFEPV